MTARDGDIGVGGPPDWYRDAVIYELHVRAFHDGSDDGVGDLRGLIAKLDHLHDLGATAVWLLPFYPSPLRDDGYDTADYRSVHESYGTMRDFRTLVRRAHELGLRVITELVLNHTSDAHPWFQRARRAPAGSRWRNFYVWSDTPERYREARIIFSDFESSNWSWDPVAAAYYWHRFYSHQPDLNFESADVRRAMFRLVDFWLGLGVDGLRLDAVPYLFEREGTSCENLPETHGFLRALRRHVDDRFPNRMLLAEANQWPEDAAEYFGDGDECHMAFHFPLMPRLFMAIQMEDRFPVIDILEQTPAIPDTAQWALFLRNHDELTLEMVTDEERDYMYRVYASDREARLNLGIRRRLAPLLGNDRLKIELMNGLLLSLPGTPVIYYGDEIGMGDNIYLGDRDGVRTPMQWSGDRNAGFSRANPQRLFLPTIVDPEFHYETVNVETQANNTQSLLWWMRRVLALRRRYGVFGRGELEFLHPENRKVLAFLRRDAHHTILICANLSRFAQYAELDLSAYEGSVPVELFGQTAFPSIGDLPYLLTLGPHAVYWLALEDRAALEDGGSDGVPAVAGARSIDALVSGRGRAALEGALAQALPGKRWFAGKARAIRGVTVRDALPVAGPRADLPARLVVAGVDFRDGESETYVIPVMLADGERARWIAEHAAPAMIARLEGGDEPALLVDASYDPEVSGALLDAVRRRRRLRGTSGELVGRPLRAMPRLMPPAEPTPEASVSRAEQSNTSIVFGQSLIMKMFRRVETGTNPDLELGSFLSGRYPSTPDVAGALEYRPRRGEPSTLAIVHQYMPNEGDAWRYTLDTLGLFYEWVLSGPEVAVAVAAGGLVERARSGVTEPAEQMMGSYLRSAELMGRRVAELHVALTSDAGDAAMAPEPISRMDQRALYQSMRNLTGRALALLRGSLDGLSDRARPPAEQVLGAEALIHRRFREVLDRPLGAARIRCHGDLHLGQVLFTGKDFLVIDFEGEPARTITERRLKRPALRDVAGMLRSFEYAVHAALRDAAARGLVDPASDVIGDLERWGRSWCAWTSSAFLGAYLEVAGPEPWLPDVDDQLGALLDLMLLEKAVYELAYELNNRPEWALIPLLGILELIDERRLLHA